MRVLVADDDVDLRELTARLLARHGWSVTTAACGEEALALWEAGVFDVVVLDEYMPRGNGLEVAAARRRLGDTVPVVLWTGWGGVVDRELAERLDVHVVDKAAVGRLAVVMQEIVDAA